MNSSITRYDYFLIWGHGLRHKEGIIEMIRQEGSLEILKIIEHTSTDIKKFVREVYSHDYAPYQHLQGKTKYLLSTSPSVVFIFVKNKNPDEAYFGEGEHKHVESKTIKRLKETIRDKYNDRKEDRRSEDHVIHASDNELQTEHMLQYLGYKDGTEVFEPYSSLIKIHDLDTRGEYTIQKIPLSSLFCTVLKSKNESHIIPVNDSPHYKYLNGDTGAYINYIKEFEGEFLQDDHNAKKFDHLNATLDYVGAEHPTDYILVKRTDNENYLILDGLHRAAILVKQGCSSIKGAIIERT